MGRTVAFVMARDNAVVEALVHSTVEKVSRGGSIAGTPGNRGGKLEAHVDLIWVISKVLWLL